jgi:hypothetical protein
MEIFYATHTLICVSELQRKEQESAQQQQQEEKSDNESAVSPKGRNTGSSQHGYLLQ